jgi:uncharacterized membrane protein YphA (DoxX/SURF4 family)
MYLLSRTKTTGLRFAFAFSVLYIAVVGYGIFPFTDTLLKWYQNGMVWFLQWCCDHVFQAKVALQNNAGSGDTLYDFIMIGFILSLSAIATLLWNIFAKQSDNEKLAARLTLVLRYFLAFTMFTYGLAKLLDMQFRPPLAYRLFQSYGNSSPMGLAWTFLGYSPVYYNFLGWGEVLAAVCLLWRPARRLGYILAFTISLNIMFINYCFDVCVKLFSTVLTLMSILLFIEDNPHHLHYFFSRKKSFPLQPDAAPASPKWKPVVKYILIIYVFVGQIYQTWQARLNYPNIESAPLYGIYDAEVFIRNNDTVAPLITDTTRWRKLIISYPGRATITLMNDTARGFIFQVDTVNKKITAYARLDTLNRWSYNYRFDDKKYLRLEGRSKKDSVSILLKPYDLNRFLLVSRKSQLITEQPFNR